MPNPPPPARVAELIGSLSLATDLAAGLPLESALRTSLLATELAKDLRITGQALSDTFYTGVLRFLGCTAYAHETAALAGGDDHAALRALWLVDAGKPMARLSFAGREFGRGLSALEKTRIAFRFASSESGYPDLVRAHCDLAVHLAYQLGMSHGVVESLGQVFERYDGKGAPQRLKSDRLYVPARIVQVAARVEMHRALAGPEAALAAVRARRGTELDPEVVDVFLKRAPEHLRRLDAGTVWTEFLAAEPDPRRLLPKNQIGNVAQVFARAVDMKSPYTLTHSAGVARLVVLAAQRGRRSLEELENLRLAALLHDLGRAGIPNGIWDKPGSLTLLETERMQQHAAMTDSVLGSAHVWNGAARVAGLHHERLDGSGYVRRLSAASMPWSVRVLAAADVYQALIEPRPHRAAMAPPEAAEELRQAARTGKLDPGVVDSLLIAIGAAPPRGRAAWPSGLNDGDVDVLRLMARGLPQSEIAAGLSLPPRSVQQHLQVITSKTGISTRVAAAIFAVERGLLESN